MQTIIVDMTPGFRMPTIYYSQGDVGTQFAIDLRSRFGDSFPTGTTVTIQATKPSGFGFSVAATSVTNGVATFTTTAEMTDEFGRFPAELKVTKTGLTLFTANFYMDGERNTHPEGTTDGSQETVIPELTQLVERVEDAASSVLDMTVVANTLPAGSDATYSYDEETNTATFGIPKGADGSLASGVLAPTYSSSSTYAVGDYVYYSGSLYRCTTAITTAEAWTSGHWTQVALAPEVSDLKSAINLVENGSYFAETSLQKSNFIQGMWGADGQPTTMNNRIRASAIKVSSGDYVLYAKGTMAADTYISFALFANEPKVGVSQTALQSTDWIKTSDTFAKFSCNYDGYLAINIRLGGNAVVAPTDYNASVICAILTELEYVKNLEELEQGVNNGYFINNYTLKQSDFIQGFWLDTSVFSSTSDSLYSKRIAINDSVPVVKGTSVMYDLPSDHYISFKVFENKAGTSQTALQETDWLSGSGAFAITNDGYLTVNYREGGNPVISPSDYDDSTYVVTAPIQTYYDIIESLKRDIVGVGAYPYYGEKIRLDSYNFNVEQIGSVAINSEAVQGACVYGDKLFQMYTGSKFAVYNLLDNTLSDLFSFDASTPYLHSNSACFGNKQNNADSYPLLYVNSYLDTVGKGVCCVEKIIESSGTYTTEHIQTISIDFTDQEIWTGEVINPQTLANANFLVDTVGNRLIAYVTQGFARTRFFMFELPTLTDSSVTLSQSDILDYFDLAYIANIQDACLHNGTIYMTAGIDWGDYDRILRIYAINLSGRSIVSEIHLEEISALNSEPEGIAYYDDSLVVTIARGRAYKLTF